MGGTVNSTVVMNRTSKTSVSTFRETVQRGVLSGIGLLKKWNIQFYPWKG